MLQVGHDGMGLPGGGGGGRPGLSAEAAVGGHISEVWRCCRDKADFSPLPLLLLL